MNREKLNIEAKNPSKVVCPHPSLVLLAIDVLRGQARDSDD